jgi:hypothetical protein
MVQYCVPDPDFATSFDDREKQVLFLAEIVPRAISKCTVHKRPVKEYKDMYPTA